MIAYAPYTFLIVSLLIIPLLVVGLCKWADRTIRRRCHWTKSYGWLVSLIAVLCIWGFTIYGSTIGFQQLEVNHYTYSSPTLPKAFDGYRIVQFSDAHVGSYSGSRQWILEKAIDSINAQQPDVIVFTGDLQNIEPCELDEHLHVLSRLKAKDGVYSILGNHDYDFYKKGIKGGELKGELSKEVQETIQKEREMGWQVLLNEHNVIRRGSDSIVIAGMENDGDGKRFPQRGDIEKTLNRKHETFDTFDTTPEPFILMLEHDPSAWRRKIIPDGRAQLTLSGHTHKMQFSIFGWCPLSLKGGEFNGWYHEGEQSLYVTSGLGGLIPFRLGATGEIVVITLRQQERRIRGWQQ